MGADKVLLVLRQDQDPPIFGVCVFDVVVHPNSTTEKRSLKLLGIDVTRFSSLQDALNHVYVKIIEFTIPASQVVRKPLMWTGTWPLEFYIADWAASGHPLDQVLPVKPQGLLG